jgi:hypothetical protein
MVQLDLRCCKEQTHEYIKGVEFFKEPIGDEVIKEFLYRQARYKQPCIFTSAPKENILACKVNEFE